MDDQQLAVLRIRADRRRVLGEDHTRMVCQLHHLLLELIPGGAKKDLSAAQTKALLAKVRPRDAAGKARRRVAAELISDLERAYQRKKGRQRGHAAHTGEVDMHAWEWVLAGLIAWLAAAVALALWLGPVLGRWSQAREAAGPCREVPAGLRQLPRQWQRAS